MALHGHVGSSAALVAYERGRPGAPVQQLALRLIRSFQAPSWRGSRGSIRAAIAFAAAGAFTISWERFGNIGAGPYNVKLPVVLFAIALLLGLPTWCRRALEILRDRRRASVIVALAAVVVLWFSVRALFVSPTTAGLGQIASVLTGAAGPGLVVLGLGRTREDLRWLLVWVVRGGLFAGAFGLWQLFAFYTGLPQVVVYTGVGTSGVGGRIAAFSYEPAYFAYFLVLAAGAALAVARIDGRVLPWRLFVFFGVVLALANVRALVFLLPVVAVLLAVDWRRNARSLARGAVVAVFVIGGITVVPGAVQTMVQQVSQPSATRSKPAAADRTPLAEKRHHDTAASSAPTADPDGAAKDRPAVVAPSVESPTAVLDPGEQSSNAPRLAVYRATLAVDLQNPWVGVGPGGLRQALGGGEGVPTQGGLVVANNVYLQAAADGGVPLLLLEVTVLALMAAQWWRSRGGAVQPLAASWLGVVAVGGMLTSYFFDVKLWVLGAVIVAAAASSTRTADVVTRARG